MVNSPVRERDVSFDPVLRRYRATCPTCGYVAVRAKREAAVHVLSQHLAYADHKEAKKDA